MNMTQYRDLTFADTDRLNFEDRKIEQEKEAARLAQEAQEQELLKKLEDGQISQAEYDTLSVTTVPQAVAAQNPGFIMPPPPDNTALLDQLTDEDYQYLNLK